MIVHYNGDDDGDGNICGDNRQKDEPCFHVLIHLDFVSHTYTQAKSCRWWSTGVGGHSKGVNSLFEIPSELPDGVALSDPQYLWKSTKWTQDKDNRQ